MTETASDYPATRPPWDRFGWVMSVVWLVFLIFPLVALWTEEMPIAGRIGGTAIIAAFSAVYTISFLRLDWSAGLEPKLGAEPYIVLAILAALGIGLGMLVGLGALGIATYLVAYSMFALRPRLSAAVGGAWCLLVIVIVVASGHFDEFWLFIAISVGVGFVTGLVRWMESGQAAHQRMQHQLTLLAERERVARDVHDVLGHSLTVVTVKAELAGRLVDRDPDAAKAEMADIQSMSRQALAEIRATVAGLRVARLDDELEHARGALAGAGIEAVIPADAEEVDPRHRIVIAWVLREAVTNVVRHSRARTCRIELATNRLVVTDDGVGVPDQACSPAVGSSDGNGLRGASERVRDAGGTLSISTTPGGGTQVEVQL